MNILVLQGPNLNLIGVRSAQAGQRLTLDKINRALHSQALQHGITLKTLQTQRVDKALAFLHRNRNAAQGILLAPMAWARYEFSLLEALDIIRIPCVQVLFAEEFDFGPTDGFSIFSNYCIDTVCGPPDTAFLAGLDVLLGRQS
ncbi:MAG: type II 3-dehydroquinate dehydratase [Candidatus Neomarinimicrobiota bacterium]